MNNSNEKNEAETLKLKKVPIEKNHKDKYCQLNKVITIPYL